MAGGMGLLCMTDMAVAVDHVMFGLPEVKVGVFPMQVLSLLQLIAPQCKVREWALSGEPFGADEALEAGLVNHVVPRPSPTPRSTGCSGGWSTSRRLRSAAAATRCERSRPCPSTRPLPTPKARSHCWR
jgi:enoyl-CoA hydratase/carnithine racemase